jgi:hypothetical protein
MNYIEMLYRLAISLWAGGNAIFTLMLTPILFKTEGRDTAARIVGNLFPGYFRWGIACGIVAIICRGASRGVAVSLPVAALLSVIVGLFGALAALWLTGLANNVYAQIGIVVLIALAAKNAILVIEVAMHERAGGSDPVTAATS